jgi:tetratricopeptide (TPR) repeat protein
MLRTFRSAAWRLVITLALAMALAPISVAAQQYVDTEALDTLFAELREAPDAATAQQIDQRIWSIWLTPTDPELASRMSAVLQARGRGDAIEAIQLLNLLVEDYPDYAEGWNQRATMLYIVGNFPASIADCARVLELEPRHFGALSGRAIMYLQLDQRSLALKDMTTALEIHPFLNERRLFPELQQEITRI